MSKLNDLIKENTYVFKLAASVLGIIVLFISVDSYLDNKIERKITDIAYIKELSNQLRPFLLFDEQGIVTFDHGAYKEIKEIKVNIENKNIIIETKGFYQNAPFLIAVGADTYSFNVERIDSKKWRYNMLYYELIAGSGGSKVKPGTTFILELF